MRPPSPLPTLTSRADNNVSNDDDNSSDNDNDGVDQLPPQGQDDDNDDNRNNNNADGEEVIVIGHTDVKDWKQINDGSRMTRRHIDPIPYTPCDGDGEFFDVKIPEEDLKDLYDENGDIRYHKVHEWSLPRFGQERYWGWIVTRMRNYMLNIVRHDRYKPRYYNPKKIMRYSEITLPVLLDVSMTV